MQAVEEEHERLSRALAESKQTVDQLRRELNSEKNQAAIARACRATSIAGINQSCEMAADLEKQKKAVEQVTSPCRALQMLTILTLWHTCTHTHESGAQVRTEDGR